MHLHLVQFKVVGRWTLDMAKLNKALAAAGFLAPPPAVFNKAAVNPAAFVIGPMRAPDFGEEGFKDTAKSMPGEMLRVVAKFDGGWQDADLANGKPRGQLLIDFGNDSFRLGPVVLAGGTLVVNDNRNRTLAYSLATGKKTGGAFGAPLDVAQSGSMVLVQNVPGQLTLYSLPLMQRLDDLTFPCRVTLARFQADDTRLFVLTEDQTAYVLTVGPF